eukprot:1709300-Pyramimonas_sp.AAC.1
MGGGGAPSCEDGCVQERGRRPSDDSQLRVLLPAVRAAQSPPKGSDSTGGSRSPTAEALGDPPEPPRGGDSEQDACLRRVIDERQLGVQVDGRRAGVPTHARPAARADDHHRLT